MGMELEALTRQSIGCAIEVHRELGPGFLESIYEASMAVALRDAGIVFEFQKLVPISFRNTPVGEHRLDLLIERQLIVELKAVRALEDVHFAQVRSYLKACDLKHGLLLNFHNATLTVRRVIRDEEWLARREASDTDDPDLLA